MASSITITEALAELKIIDKRLEKKRQFVLDYLCRQSTLRDPLEKSGGSQEVIKQEHQSIRDLEQRKIDLRRAIAKANEVNHAMVCGEHRTIAEWLVWKRDVAPSRQKFLVQMRQRLDAARLTAQRAASTGQPAGGPAEAPDVVVNVRELDLAQEAEKLEEVLGTLDGKLSLRNATITVDV